ncbi:MAG: thrombospondin type 3 repeat-containing protein [Spirochaetaceae bacterium]|jgi:hypothetical protein|nr:thrombospondin type 3 repeat-containing protein [Spirochaetaceae bacterium]
MKIAKQLFFVPSGILALLILAGCLNPVSSVLPGAKPDSGAVPVLRQGGNVSGLAPFTVTLTIGEDGSARAVAGPTGTLIGTGGICNVIQLVVVDPATNNVHTETDIRQGKAADTSATLQVNALTYEKNYEFLLLMGHWQRDYVQEQNKNNGLYQYDAAHPPTLLVVGHKTASINSGNNTVTIPMYPLVIDTQFTNSTTTVAAAVGGVSLTPGTWSLIGEVIRGTPGTNGFAGLLTAQEKISGKKDVNTLFTDASGIVNGNPVRASNKFGVAENRITLNIADYTKSIGAGAAANFNLKYVPFSLKNTDWSRFNTTSNFDLSAGKAPEWIIRNGVNDLAQTAHTDFSSPHAWGGAKNGNGAIGFTVLDPKVDTDGDGYPNGWEIANGYDPIDPGSHPAAAADTDGDGFSDGVEIAKGTDPTDKEDYPGNLKPYLNIYVKSSGNDTNPGDKAHPLATVQKALEQLKAAYASDPSWPGKGTGSKGPGGIIVLDRVNVSKQIDIDGKNGGYPPIILRDDPDAPGGTLQAMATIGTGTDKSILYITNGADVTLSGSLTLEGTKKDADHIRGIYISDSTFTLKGGKISGHYRGGVSNGTGGGVYLNGGTFTMNSGEISDNSAAAGGGVYIEFTNSSTFTMNGGKISKNLAIDDGGGVFINGQTFTMNGGEISGNSVVSSSNAVYGGGVYLNGGTFTMNGGEISKNFADSSQTAHGGGVYIVRSALFTMNKGKISGNSATSPGGAIKGIVGTGGGGVYVGEGTFIMIDGEIAGNSIFSTYTVNNPAIVAVGGGVAVSKSGYAKFAKTGGTIYGYNAQDPTNSNTVQGLSGIMQDKGHAVYVQINAYDKYYKEGTVGPGDTLYYKYPGKADTGW